MRTTLTLDPDVAPRASSRPPARYRVLPHKTTVRPGVDPGSLNKLADGLEDEAVVARMRKHR